MKQFGFFTDNNLYIARDVNSYECHEYNTNDFLHMGDIVDIAIKHNVYNIWIGLHTELSKRFTNKFVIDAKVNYYVWQGFYHFDINEPEFYVKTWKLQGSPNERETVHITIPENSEVWEVKKNVTNKILLGALVHLHNVLDTYILKTPSTNGLYLLEKRNNGIRVKWLDDIDLSELPNQNAQDLHWKKENVATDKKYLHVYDRSSAYLANGQSIQVGVGTPVYYDNIREFDKTKCGLWHVKISGTSVFNGVDLPLPYYISIMNDYDKDLYLWSPELEITLMLGYELENVIECWLYPERHKVFSLWATDLWKKLQILKDKRENSVNEQEYKMLSLAIDMLKSFYTHAVGKLATDKGNKKDLTFLRRDWRNMIISDGRLKILYHVNKMYQEYGIKPIGILTDDVYILSNSPNPEDTPYILSRKNLLGGFKVKHSIQWCEVEQVFNSTSDINVVAKFLNDRRNENG